MATLDRYVKAIQIWLQWLRLMPPEMSPPDEAECMLGDAMLDAMLEEGGLTCGELNQEIVLICVECGFTRKSFLSDFHGERPSDVCPQPGCGGLIREDRKGKPPRRMFKDDGLN